MALSVDVPAGSVAAALTPGGRLALWRSASGALSAVDDRCPHRGMRLSHGFVRGEALSCIYHGWSYGQDGRCRRIPAHPGLEPPEAVRVATHQVAEQGGVIWIAEAGADAPPPTFGGFEALRSLTTTASLDEIEAAAGATTGADGLIRLDLAGTASALLVAPAGPDLLIHVLHAPAIPVSARKAIAVAADSLRRAAEALSATRGAA